MRQALYKFGLWSLLSLSLTACGNNERKPKQISPPAPVNIETAKVLDAPIYIETIGNVYSPCVVDIKPQVSGVLLKTYVKQGQLVDKGDILYTIDSRPYQAALNKAKANLAKNEAHLQFTNKRVERFSDLVKKEFISQLTFEEYQKEAKAAEAQVQNDLAEVALAEINLDYCTITSPIDGRISQFQVFPGNVVSAHDHNALTEIRQISPICVHFTVSQKNLQQMQRLKNKGDSKVDVILPHEEGEEYANDTYTGHVFFMDNHLDQTTGTILLKAEVENEEHMLWPGEFVRIRLLLCEKKGVLTIPQTALQLGQTDTFVYVVQEDMTVRMQPIKTGEKIGTSIIVVEGLQDGDRVVTTGQLNLTSGKKVFVAKDALHESL